MKKSNKNRQTSKHFPTFFASCVHEKESTNKTSLKHLYVASVKEYEPKKKQHNEEKLLVLPHSTSTQIVTTKPNRVQRNRTFSLNVVV